MQASLLLLLLLLLPAILLLLLTGPCSVETCRFSLLLLLLRIYEEPTQYSGACLSSTERWTQGQQLMQESQK
jgi:hypothetical protein